MSAPLHLTVDGAQREVEAGTTAAALFEGRPEVVATKVNGELKDLFAVPVEGDVLEPVLLDSEDGFHVLRHSAAHVMAQAVGRLFPGAKYGIGPDIKNGFYYDFDVERPFTPEDLKAIEKEMQKIVNEGQHFERVVVTDEECREVLADQPYKLELVVKKGGGGKAEDIAEGADLEVGGTELTFYHNVNRKGERTWGDLCRGPHLPTTKLLGANFKLMRSASAYWLGSEKNKQLQRIYGTAWASKDQLKDYLYRLEEAEKRDHRKLGAELDLFSFPEEIGSGLPIFHPKGGVIKKAMEDYVRERHVEEGFLYVGTPHISKEGLFHTSGHLPYYEDTMFPSMNVDEVVGDDGEVIKPGQRYFLKAMNCPMHNLIYKSQQRSYRDLPLRYFEFGRVHRYEKSGVVHGLTRVRGFDQDDSHSYVTEEQAPAEIEHLLKFILGLLKDFGMSDYYLEVSTRSDDPEKAKKFMGSDEQWAAATAVLQKVADESGLRIVPDPGGAAFYGPKISIKALDAIGREWQMSTIQYDFNQPERFGLEYVDSDGARKRPVMIHSAKFGSIERFMGVLVEHYAGAFPVWLSPVQALLVPVAEEYVPYLEQVAEQMVAKGIRVELDKSDDRFPKKIRNASKSKVPYTLIAGEEDRSKNAVSFRYRNGEQENGVPVQDAIAKIVAAIESREQA